MKLFQKILIAPAALGLLTPISATASEVTMNDFAAAILKMTLIATSLKYRPSPDNTSTDPTQVPTTTIPKKKNKLMNKINLLIKSFKNH